MKFTLTPEQQTFFNQGIKELLGIKDSFSRIFTELSNIGQELSQTRAFKGSAEMFKDFLVTLDMFIQEFPPVEIETPHDESAAAAATAATESHTIPCLEGGVSESKSSTGESERELEAAAASQAEATAPQTDADLLPVIGDTVS